MYYIRSTWGTSEYYIFKLCEDNRFRFCDYYKTNKEILLNRHIKKAETTIKRHKLIPLTLSHLIKVWEVNMGKSNTSQLHKYTKEFLEKYE